MTHREEFRKRKEAAKAKHEATGEYTSAGSTAATKAVAAGDVTGGGMSPGFAAKFQQTQAGQPTLPTQLPQEQAGGIWNWLKDKYYGAVGDAQGGIDPRMEAQISAEPMPGASMNQLLTLGAAASVPILAAKAVAAMGARTATAGVYKTIITAGAKTTTAFEAAKLKGGLVAIPTNIKTLGLTEKILAGLGISGGAVTLALAVLGSYPFAGFVGKEEATQTLGFGFKAAMDAGDYDLADAALDQMDEVLNGASSMGDKLPVSNIMNSLTDDFIPAARVTLAAKRELVKRMRDGTDKWSLTNKEQEEAAARITADRIEQQRIANEAEAEIRKQAREARDKEERKILEETIALWKKHKEEILEMEKQARIEQAKFWLEYTKEKMRLLEERGRSQLGFGLLG